MNKKEISLEALVASEDFQRYCLSPQKSDIDYLLDQLMARLKLKGVRIKNA